jgi:hypothetical protein
MILRKILYVSLSLHVHSNTRKKKRKTSLKRKKEKKSKCVLLKKKKKGTNKQEKKRVHIGAFMSLFLMIICCTLDHVSKFLHGIFLSPLSRRRIIFLLVSFICTSNIRYQWIIGIWIAK